MESDDVAILRELAGQVAGIARRPIQEERRALWRKHNGLQRTRPLILVSIGRWDGFGYEVLPASGLRCRDILYRDLEFVLRMSIFQDGIADDSIIEPWVSISAVHRSSGWGIEPKPFRSPRNGVGNAYKMNPPIRNPQDFAKLVLPSHSIDEEATQKRFIKAQNAIGDLLVVHLDRGPAYNGFGADISYWLGQLLGVEQIMYDMHDRPEWLHQVAAFFQKGILKVQEEAELAGDWSSCSHVNQAMPYSEELPDPRPDSGSVPQKRLWGFFAAQEFAAVSPEMHREFLLQYQLPIMERYGLIAYGCCEDLTRKIGMLRGIPNLRRIAVSPWADLGKCAGQIRQEYVLSWRPNPADMICADWNPDLIRKTIAGGMDVSRECIVDVTLKDIQTVRNEPWRYGEWVKIARDAMAPY
jgi:hypothetical protein